MSTENEQKPEVIVNPPNRKLFPNALPHDNAPMDTTRIPNREIGPIEDNDTVREAIEAASRERDKTEVFIDRREPVTLKRTVEAIQNGAGVLRGKAAEVATKIAEVTKTLDTLRKLLKQTGRLKANAFAEETLKQVKERITEAEEALAELRRKEKVIANDIKQNAKSLPDFLAARPRPHLPTNGELLEMYRENETLERELHQIDHLSRSKAGMFI